MGQHHKDNPPKEEIRYKGYIGEYEYKEEDELFFGTITNIDDCVTFEASNIIGINNSFCDAVEDYIKLCEEAEKEPSIKEEKTINTQPHYKNDESLYLVADKLGLNHWEFDIFKRLTRCRKKGEFVKDLNKIKDTIDIYLKEYETK